MSKKKKVVPVVIALTLSGSLALSACDNKQAHQQVAHSPAVNVVTLKTEALPVSTELPGRTSAFRVAEVRPQVSGIILTRNFTEGSDVRAGSSLYQIDSASYQAAYDSAKGDLAKARASANIARLTLARYQKLINTQYISKQDFDNAEAQLQQADAAVQAASAAVQSGKINLDYTQVKAPISGRIGKSNVTEGALVQNGQPAALTTITQLDPVYVDVSQSSSDFLRLKQEITSGKLKQENGKVKVELIISNNQPYPHTGTLEFSDVTVDPTTGSITLRALFPNPDHLLLPGMFVRAKLDEGINPDVILVPQQSVSRNQRGDASVMLVDKDNKVHEQKITVTQAIGDKWLVNDGLKAGDRVVISGLQKIRPGIQVQPEEQPVEQHQLQQTLN